MSEKRFIVIDHSTCVFDKITKEKYVEYLEALTI